MRVLCVVSQYNYGDPRRGVSYEYANFVPTLRQQGHEVFCLENWNRPTYGDFVELNRALLRAVQTFAPDVILAFQVHYEIWLETWQILRDAGIAATVNWTTDDSWKYSQFSRFLAPAFHAFTTTYPKQYEQYHRDGHFNVLLTQWAANSANLQIPLPAKECKYLVSFVGSAHGKRASWINALRKRGIAVSCFGHGWDTGPVTAEEIPHIIRNSVISLNLSNGSWDIACGRSSSENQIKARTFEVPGAGGFLLTEWADGLQRYYMPGSEIAVFKTLDDLAQQIQYYLSHLDERDYIAHAGFKRTGEEHTYAKRLTQVLTFALEQRDNFFTRAGTQPTGKINEYAFDQAVKRHVVTPSLRLLKRILTLGCSAIWGPVRGPRAARRLAFEISWRLVGARTYSSAGLPGRMFYEVS